MYYNYMSNSPFFPPSTKTFRNPHTEIFLWFVEIRLLRPVVVRPRAVIEMSPALSVSFTPSDRGQSVGHSSPSSWWSTRGIFIHTALYIYTSNPPYLSHYRLLLFCYRQHNVMPRLYSRFFYLLRLLCDKICIKPNWKLVAQQSQEGRKIVSINGIKSNTEFIA